MQEFGSERLDALRKRNALNKQRSRSMETAVARILGGKRVPFSGAGSIKGDIIVKGGLIECKMSAAYDSHLNDPFIILSFSWLTKIKEEAVLMRSLGITFSALVFHFHNVKGYGVLIDTDSLLTICHNFGELYPARIVLTLSKKTMKIYNRYFNNWMQESPVVYVDTPVGIYALMRIETLKELLDEKV